LLLGLYYLKKWWQLEGIRAGISGLTVVLLTGATPLFYYTVCEPAMSHVYSFALVSAFCYFTRREFLRTEGRNWTYSLVLFGLITAVRPVNALIALALPFLAGNGMVFMKALNGKPSTSQWLNGLVILLATLFIQPLLFKIQSGHWWVYTYGAEELTPSRPHVAEFLFSYRKGFFIYTPFAVLALAGFLFRREDRTRKVALSLFLIVVIWILSSWSIWWYGGSFSQRAMTEYLPFFGFLFALSLQQASRPVRIAAGSAAVSCLLVCQLQTYQYRYYWIHWEKMDREHYWRVFLKTDGITKGVNPNKDLL
jgi:hypothetical protein